MSKFYAIKLNNGKYHKHNLGSIVCFTNKQDAQHYMRYNHYDGEIMQVNIGINLDQQIAELKKQLEEKEKDSQFLKKMYLSEKTKNDNYHTEKYGLNKPVEELRKIKLNPKEKEIYYKGFDNCERQFATHIAELQQQLKSQPAEIVEKIKSKMDNVVDTLINLGNGKEDAVAWFCSILQEILKEYGGEE